MAHIELLSIGNELLAGSTLNTNAQFLSRELSLLGFKVSRHTVIGDGIEEIQQAVKQAMSRSSLLLVTGGLGPTTDDRTLEAVAPLFPKPPTPLPNRVGVAPGALFATSQGAAIFLPGVPREMEAIFVSEVLPWIETHFSEEREFVYTFSLCRFLEVEIDPYLRDLEREHPEIECGIYPAQGTVRISLRAKRKLEDIGKAFEAKFPGFVFHDKNIETAVHRVLIERQETLGLAESCTGGAVAARLAAIPNASYFLKGSLVVYANEWKHHFLKVPPHILKEKGAVSAETIEAMIQGIFKETDVDYAIAISGIAGPGGGTARHPVGTIFIGVAKRGERMDVGKVMAPRERLSAIDFAVQTSLCALYRRIVYHVPTFS